MWLPLSAPAQLSAPACVPASERVSEGASAAPPRRAAPAAPLSMCSGAHPVLNNSGHVNSVSPAARAAGARPGEGGSPQPRTGISRPCLGPHREAPKLLLHPHHAWGPHLAPLPGHQGRGLHPESLAYSATFLDHTPEGSDNSIPHLLASLTPNSSTQPPPDLSTPLTAPSRELLRKATCLNEGGEGRAENRTGQARQTRGP